MNVLFLSPHFPPNFWNFCRGLREAGANPLGLADEPWETLRPELRGALAEYYRVQDMHRHDELVRALGWLTFRHGKIDRLDSMSEYWLETEARLRDDFNVFGLRGADMARFKRKSEMKRLYRRAGIAVARGRLCPTRESLLELIEEVGYPVVAKPDTGVGAAQTFKIEGERELEAFLLARPQVDYIVEEFISAPMVTYDGLADRQGRVVFETSFEYGRGVMEVVNQDAEITYTILRDIPADLVEAGRAIVEAFGVRERFFHFEFFRLPSGGLVALEVNVRPPGGFTVDMWNYQGDIDMYREWGNLLVKGRMETRATRPFFVTWVGRKDRFRYAASQAELRDRLGPLLVHHTRVDDIFSRAIGNEGFILRSPEREPLLEAAAAIQQKA
jgi:hypothetical protein